MSTTRFAAFSDGVFAFAATLLILGLALPERFSAGGASEAQLTGALLGLWPKFVAYLLGFAVIAIMWQQHHALFRLVKHVDRVTILWNLALLCVTAFIPFATSVLGSYPTTRPATVLYGLALVSSAICFNALVWHLERTRAFRPEVSAATIRRTAVAYHLGLGTYAIATLAGFVLPLLSFALYLLVAEYFVVPRGVDADLPEHEGASADR
jgi:uncharacterized membrane protein